MFGFIKKSFVVSMTFFSYNILKCVSMNNQECKISSEIIDINSNKPTFYPYNININRCSGSCSNVNDSYSKLCASSVAKT